MPLGRGSSRTERIEGTIGLIGNIYEFADLL